MPGSINVVLDAEDEVTPTFTWRDIYGPESINYGQANRVTAQCARTTNTSNAVDIALDACGILDDGTLLQRHNGTALEDAWHPLNANFMELAGNEDDELKDNQFIQTGFAYRLRYDSSQTDPIRVWVYCPHRKD